ncbi:MAG: hypothetical protein ACREO8_12620, partial [Luteimonas sp.]
MLPAKIPRRAAHAPTVVLAGGAGLPQACALVSGGILMRTREFWRSSAASLLVLLAAGSVDALAKPLSASSLRPATTPGAPPAAAQSASCAPIPFAAADA